MMSYNYIWCHIWTALSEAVIKSHTRSSEIQRWLSGYRCNVAHSQPLCRFSQPEKGCGFPPPTAHSLASGAKSCTVWYWNRAWPRPPNLATWELDCAIRDNPIVLITFSFPWNLLSYSRVSWLKMLWQFGWPWPHWENKQKKTLQINSYRTE